MSRSLPLARIPPRVVLVSSAALVLGLAVLMGRVGADAGWLAALGHVIAQRHAIPDGVPFAFAPTTHWPNALVLAELIFAGLEGALGDWGLVLAQLLAVGAAMYIINRDARSGGARAVGVGAALLLLGLGVLPSLAIARVQMFSLLLFPLLAALLRAQTRRPTREIWLAVPLLALWSNLHGAALLGAGMVLVYLVVARGGRQPLQSLAIAVASLVALCFTPAGLNTVTYYSGLLGNQAAQRGDGMWGPLSLTAPLDVVMLVAGLWLGYKAWRARPCLWELAMMAVLALLTIKADRDGVWLLMFLAVPAARSLAPERSLRTLTPPIAAAAALALVIGAVRGPLPSGASPGLLTSAIAAAHGSPVLADSAIDEQVAMDGGRVWAGNPIDAFSRRVQIAYLDWLAGERGGLSALPPSVRVVLVSRGSATQALMARLPGFVVARADAGAVMYERTS